MDRLELAARVDESVLALPTASHVDSGLPNGIIHGRGSRCLVSVARQVPGFCTEDCRSGNRFRDSLDRRTGFHRRHCLRHHAQIPTVKDAGGRGLLGKTITVAGTVLLVHNSGPKESAKSVRAGNTLSRKYLADPQPQRSCRGSEKYTTRAPAQNGTRIFCISNHVLFGDAHVRRGSRFTLVAIPRDALRFSMVSLDAGLHDPIRDYCDIGGVVCCRDWTTTMGHLWHPEDCRRSISCSRESAPVDSDRVRLRLRRLHHCLPSLYIPHYPPRACGSSCLRRSVWFYKERIPAVRSRQPETIGG